MIPIQNTWISKSFLPDGFEIDSFTVRAKLCSVLVRKIIVVKDCPKQTEQPSKKDLKKSINLENTALDFKAVVNSLEEKTLHFNKGKAESFTDFGVILVGCDSSDEFVSRVCALESMQAPIFTAPVGWRMPQILRALGCFKSATEAAKNGWNKDVETGLSSHIIRVNNIKGVIHIFKMAKEENDA